MYLNRAERRFSKFIVPQHSAVLGLDLHTESHSLGG
jgi:hypothetical protein